MNIAIHTRPQGIFSINLPFIEENIYSNKDSILGFISDLNIDVFGPHPLGKTLAQEIKDYLHGKNLVFSDYPMLWSETTTFGKCVLSALKDIPYGETVSYSDLSRIIGCPAAGRAVGQALKKNPWPILYPCHRVIGKNGQLKGFSSGIVWKRTLLRIERSVKEVNG